MSRGRSRAISQDALDPATPIFAQPQHQSYSPALFLSDDDMKVNPKIGKDRFRSNFARPGAAFPRFPQDKQSIWRPILACRACVAGR